MTSKQILSRWRIIKTRFEKDGIDCDLDLVSLYQLNVRIKTSRASITEHLEWAFTNWPDVRACWQSQDDHSRYFIITFKKPKGWSADKDDEAEQEQEAD